MSNFREITPQRLQNGCSKKFQTLKYEHITYHFKADSGDSVNINCFARYLNFAKIRAKADFAKFLKVFIKSRKI